jgi:hypothetical protein
VTRTDQEGLQIRENDQSATSPDRDGVNASPNSSVVHDESGQDQQAPQGKQDDREREVADEVSDRGRQQCLQDRKCQQALVCLARPAQEQAKPDENAEDEQVAELEDRLRHGAAGQGSQIATESNPLRTIWTVAM